MPHLRSAVGAAALVLGAAAPIGVARADAAPACTAQEVTVVVDFGALGSPLVEGCAPARGNAASLFLAAGDSLRYAQQFPGAVCQVNQQPATTPCQQMPPGNAYWGLFWTDGTTTHWTYSSFGVQSLTVPAGGSVAFAWQDSTTPRAPAVTPAVTRSASSPTPKPAPHHRGARSVRPTHAAGPTIAATPAHASSSPSARATPTPTSAPTSPPTPAPTAVPSSASAAGLTPDAAPSPDATANPAPVPTSARTSNGGGLPTWVPVGLIGLLVLGGGVVAAVRRRA